MTDGNLRIREERLFLSNPLVRIRNDAWLHLTAIGKAIDLFDVGQHVGCQKGDDALLLFTRLGIITIVFIGHAVDRSI